MYRLLRDRAAAFRADPEVQDALRAARVAELSTPTLSPNETWKDILGNDTIAKLDVDAAGAKGYGFVRLQQLAVEHLMGAR
jgi:xylose isomerase